MLYQVDILFFDYRKEVEMDEKPKGKPSRWGWELYFVLVFTLIMGGWVVISPFLQKQPPPHEVDFNSVDRTLYIDGAEIQVLFGKLINYYQLTDGTLVLVTAQKVNETLSGDTIWTWRTGEELVMVQTGLLISSVHVHPSKALFIYTAFYRATDGVLDPSIVEIPIMVWEKQAISRLTPTIDRIEERGRVYNNIAGFSPDGTKVLFTSGRDQWESTRSNHSGVYVIDLDGSNLTYVSWRSRYASSPGWLDNERVFFFWWETRWGHEHSVSMNDSPPLQEWLLETREQSRDTYLSVVDIANPAATEVAVNMGGATRFSVHGASSDGNYLYMVDSETGFWLFDTHNLASPIMHSETKLAALAQSEAQEWRYGETISISLQHCLLFEEDATIEISFTNGSYEWEAAVAEVKVAYPMFDPDNDDRYCDGDAWLTWEIWRDSLEED